MKTKLSLSPKTKMQLSLSLQQKIIIGSSLTAIIIFVTIFLYNNLATVKYSAAASGNLLLNSRSNTSLQFNGTTSYANAGSVNFILDKKLTVNVWVKWDTIPSSGNTSTNIVSMNSNLQSDIGQFWIQHNSNNSKFEFAVSTENSRKVVQSTTTPVAHTWYHISGVYNDGIMSIYVNGVLEGTASQTQKVTALQSAYKFVIGGSAYSSDNYRRFKGEIDEVSVFNKALSVSKIRDLMCVSLNPNTSGLKGYWTMDNITGNILLDYSGNNFNAAIVNSTTKLSGAPIGIKSKWVFGNVATSLSFSHPNGDQLTVDSLSSAVNGILIYYTDTLINYDSSIISSMIPVRNFTWGIFNSTSGSVSFRVNYSYQITSDISNENLLAIKHKRENDSILWNYSQALPDVTTRTINYHFVNRREVALYQKISSITLPVTFGNISAQPNKDENYIIITWDTHAEINNDYFSVERSIDGSNFEIIGTIKGAGNSNSIQNYYFDDLTPSNGINYYRIRQTDFDGISSLSKTIAVYNRINEFSFSDFIVSPNPCKDYIEISLNSNINGNISICIINQAGQIIIQKEYDCVEGFNKYHIDAINNLTAGNYFVTLFRENVKIQSIKIIKN